MNSSDNFSILYLLYYSDMRNFELSSYELELNYELNCKIFWTLNLVRTKSQILLQINMFFTTCTDSSEGAS